MPGYRLNEVVIKDRSVLSKYKCPSCTLILKDAVSLIKCGHSVCKSCLNIIVRQELPVCPQSICCEPFQCNEDSEWFLPDHSIRHEIMNLDILCQFYHNGCPWEGKLQAFEDHVKDCRFTLQELSMPKESSTKSGAKPAMLTEPMHQNVTGMPPGCHYNVTTMSLGYHTEGTHLRESASSLSPVSDYARPEDATTYFPSKSELVVGDCSKQINGPSILTNEVQLQRISTMMKSIKKVKENDKTM